MEPMKDIKLLLSDIQRYGLSDSEIARRVSPCSQPTIQRLRVGVTKDCMSSLRIRIESLLENLKKSGSIKT